MRTKVTLVLVFLNVALFFFIFKFERHWRTETESLEARRRVLGPEASDIRFLEITNSTGTGSFSLARRADTWWVTKPLEWPANRPAVERIINELIFLDHVTSFNVRDLAKNDQSLASYGLEKPKLTIAFTSGEGTSKPITLQIGDTVGNNLYVLSPDGERIHVVSRALLESIVLPLEQLRADTLFTIPVYEARSLILQQQQQAASPGLRTYIRREPTRWVFETPVVARASKNAVDLTINELNELRVKSFLTQNPTVTPKLRITLEGNNRRETLLLGDRVPDSKTEFYGQFEDRSGLRSASFTVNLPEKLQDKLGKAQDDLREKHILDFDAKDVAAITLSAPNQTQLVLQRLDAKSTQPGVVRDATWLIVRRGDSSPGPLAIPADPGAVQHLLDQLAQFSATKFETESAAAIDLENWGFNRPEREIALTLDGAPTTTLAVQIGLTAQPERAAHARLGPATSPGNSTNSIYAVDAGILDETRLEPYVWRERQLPALPPAARFTALKITDLTNGQALVDIAFDATGKTTTPPRDAVAVERTLAAMHTLRARTFTQDGFTDRVFSSGEERPWRYELSTTAALPGGAAGEQSVATTLLLTERSGGTRQLAGSKEFNAVFELEQPFVDALWALIYGPRDPGPPPAPSGDAKK